MHFETSKNVLLKALPYLFDYEALRELKKK